FAGSAADAGPLGPVGRPAAASDVAAARAPAARAPRTSAALAVATQSTGAGGDLRSTGHVSASISPVTGRPLAVWKSRTALAVPAPNAPSTPTVWPAPSRCCCAHTTRSPREPTLPPLPTCSVGHSV